jgi:hypothetical protein
MYWSMIWGSRSWIKKPKRRGDIVDAFVGQFEGEGHGEAPTRSRGKPSLYCGGHRPGKIQERKREYGNYEKVGLRYNSRFTEHLICER